MARKTRRSEIMDLMEKKMPDQLDKAFIQYLHDNGETLFHYLIPQGPHVVERKFQRFINDLMRETGMAPPHHW